MAQVRRTYPLANAGNSIKDDTGRVIAITTTAVEAKELAVRLNNHQCNTRKKNGKRSVCC